MKEREYSKLGVGADASTDESALAAKILVKRGRLSPGVDDTAVWHVNSDRFPNTLPADAKSTSDLDIIVSTPEGFAVVGDRIHYTTYVIDGDGACGTLSARDAVTGSDGHSHLAYTASTDQVECAVVATDLYGGQKVHQRDLPRNLPGSGTTGHELLPRIDQTR